MYKFYCCHYSLGLGRMWGKLGRRQGTGVGAALALSRQPLFSISFDNLSQAILISSCTDSLSIYKQCTQENHHICWRRRPIGLWTKEIVGEPLPLSKYLFLSFTPMFIISVIFDKELTFMGVEWIYTQVQGKKREAKTEPGASNSQNFSCTLKFLS